MKHILIISSVAMLAACSSKHRIPVRIVSNGVTVPAVYTGEISLQPGDSVAVWRGAMVGAGWQIVENVALTDSQRLYMHISYNGVREQTDTQTYANYYRVGVVQATR